MRKTILLLTTVLSLVMVVGYASAGNVTLTKHNLSASSGNVIRSTSEDRICVFCHTPHNANPAVGLWNHVYNSTDNVYTTYNDSNTDNVNTIDGTITQPGGSTKLCLSCHDGTIALGNLLTSADATMTGATYITGSKSIGTDLRNDHPVSIVVNTSNPDPELNINPADSDVNYILGGDGQKRVECTSCHDPHDNTNSYFLRKANVDSSTGEGSQICIVCHDKSGFTTSVHQGNSKLYNGTPVKELACASCHSTHNSDSNSHLLNRDDATENFEQVCLDCHGSTGITAVDMVSAFSYTYNHPTLATDDVHQGNERELDPGVIVQDMAAGTTWTAAGSRKHAECVDCHGPHGVRKESAVNKGWDYSSKISESLVGAWGVKPYWETPESQTAYAMPSRWEVVTFTSTSDPDAIEAYLCFKCHPEKAKEFNPYNASYHAVMGDRGADFQPNTSSFGLYIGGWTRTSSMKCTDCHSSSGSSYGPHGSANGHILTDPFATTTNSEGSGGTTPMNVSNYLCGNCHSFSGTDYTTGFSERGGGDLHGRKHEDRACTSCHTIHGSRFVHLLASDDGPNYEDRNALQTLTVDSINNTELTQNWGEHDPCSISGCG